MFTFLTIQTLYQENVTLKEGARGNRPSSGAPDTYDFRKYIEFVCLEKQLIRLADNSNHVSGEHDHVRVGTTATPLNGSPDTDGSRKNFELEYHYKM